MTYMKKKVTAFTLGLTSLIVLSGCSDIGIPEGDITIAPAIPSAAPEDIEAADENFAVAMEELAPNYFSDEDKVILSDTIKAGCEILDEGGSFESFVVLMGDLVDNEGYEQSYVSSALGAGVIIYCPQHQELIIPSGALTTISPSASPSVSS